MKKIILAVGALVIAAAVAAALLLSYSGGDYSTEAYREKADLLKEQILTEEIRWEVGVNPAGSAGHAVFLSVCDTASRASVFTGTGEDLEGAWAAADAAAEEALRKSGLEPVWVKADVVYLSETIAAAELKEALLGSRAQFFRYGVAFDRDFETALLEAELNGAKIYDYENGGVDLDYLNAYLRDAGRRRLRVLPASYTVFQCIGWLCDEEKNVTMLAANGLDYGRRDTGVPETAAVGEMILSATEYLAGQVKEDGSFVYGWYPRFDEEIEGYNMVRHASAIRALALRYRFAPGEELAAAAGRAVDYLLMRLAWQDDDTAYLYEDESGEIKLGGCALAVVALTEYMDAFQTDAHTDVCRALGSGILNMLDQETGEYYHVLNGDFSEKEAFRTVTYDGEATYALCLLYGLTGERAWLDAAESAVGHFIEADYSQYNDHWVAHAMNELTKHVTDNVDYYLFALRSVRDNLEEIQARDTSHHTYLELLMVSFELYDRLLQLGAAIEGFDVDALLEAIATRAERMLDGYFFPEYAMYMENPQRVLGSFMVRQEGYRVRIDDVQHNVSGYYLYYENYGKLVLASLGLLSYNR